MAEFRPYNPTIRDRIASALMGQARPGSARANMVEGMMGSRGIGTTGMGLADLTPLGIPMAGQEAQRSAQAGDALGAGLNAMAVIPAAKAPIRAAQSVLQSIPDAAQGISRTAGDDVARFAGNAIIQNMTDAPPPRHLNALQKEAWENVPTYANKLKTILETRFGVPVNLSKSDTNFGRSWYLKPDVNNVDGQSPLVVRVSDHDAQNRNYQREARINLVKFDQDESGKWGKRLASNEDLEKQINDAVEILSNYITKTGSR